MGTDLKSFLSSDRGVKNFKLIQKYKHRNLLSICRYSQYNFTSIIA